MSPVTTTCHITTVWHGLRSAVCGEGSGPLLPPVPCHHLSLPQQWSSTPGAEPPSTAESGGFHHLALTCSFSSAVYTSERSKAPSSLPEWSLSSFPVHFPHTLSVQSLVMAYVPDWFLLTSLLPCSSFVAGKVVRGPKAQLCKDRGSAPTCHGGSLPLTQGMEALAVGQPELCGKERLAGPQVPNWRHFVKAHSRSSLAVLLYYLEQQVWEQGLLDKMGCRTSMVNKTAGSGYSSPKLSLQPENFISTHGEGLLSKSALSKPVKKGPCANKTRPKLCNQTSSMFKNITGSLYIPLLLAPFLFLSARKESLASWGLGCGWDVSVVKGWSFLVFFFFHQVLWLLDSDCSKKTCHFSSLGPASPSLTQKMNEGAQGWQEQAASRSCAPKLSLEQGVASPAQQRPAKTSTSLQRALLPTTPTLGHLFMGFPYCGNTHPHSI